MTTKLHKEGLSGDSKAFRRGPETLQLDISYRESSLSREEREAPGSLRAGDRAPDAPCQDSKGAPVRLFDLFRGPHFTVLTFGKSSSAEQHGRATRSFSIVRAGDSGNVVDADGHAFRAYDAQDGATFVIRPDGYIGRVAADASVSGTRAYLHELGAA